MCATLAHIVRNFHFRFIAFIIGYTFNQGSSQYDRRATPNIFLTLTEAAKLLPDRPSTATLWRWRTEGVRGRRLESVVIGGKVYVSREAIARFAEQHGGIEPPSIRSPAKREKEIARAEAALAAAGI